MAIVRTRRRPVEVPDVPARYPCPCKGCHNRTPWRDFVCQECFLVCNRLRKSDGHRRRVLRIGGRHGG